MFKLGISKATPLFFFAFFLLGSAGPDFEAEDALAGAALF